MKSSEMQISVYRKENGEPCFRYPKEWSGEEVFMAICELCCRLFEELNNKEVN
jgi:hypothetical protein